MKTINIFVFTSLFIIIFTVCSTALSGTATSAVEGYVKNGQTGKPIAKAKIKLVFSKSESLKYEIYSDKKGHFYKGGLNIGFYNITVEKEGYVPLQGSIRVRLEKATEIEIKLESFEKFIPISKKFSSQGSELLNAGRYEEAIEKFTEAISKDTSNPILYYYRGASLEKNGNMDKALEDYQKSIELKPDFILPVSSAAKIYARRKNFEKGIELYKKATELGNQNVITYYNYGVCLLNNGKNEEAKVIFTKLLSLDENYFDAYYQLGIIHIGLGDIVKAKEYLRKFIDMDPENKSASIAKKILKTL